MPGIPMWRRYLRFWRSDVARDVDDELRFHFDSRVAELLALGVPLDEARRQAAEEFGDEAAVRVSLQEIGDRMERRRARHRWWDAARTDLRYAVRGLKNSPLLTAAVVLTLAVGIGAATTMYGVMRRLLVQPPPGVAAPAAVRRLFFVYEAAGQPREVYSSSTYNLLQHLRTDARTVVGAAYMPGEDVVVGRGPDASPAQTILVSAGFWRTLGVQPFAGRLITDEEADPEHGARVVVLSHAYWQRRFGGDPAIIGRTIPVKELPYTVIGVAPPGFRGVELTRTDIWLPLFAYSDGGEHRDWWKGSFNLAFVVRLRPGVTSAQAADELTTLRQVASEEQDQRLFNDARKVSRMPVLLGGITGALGDNGERMPEGTVSLWLVGVAIVLLGIAVANVASLLLLRALRRRHEIAVRMALGMSRRRLAALLLTESAVLTAIGAVASVLVVSAGRAWVHRVLLGKMATEGAGVDWPLVAFAVALTIGAALATGLVPLLQLRDGIGRVNEGSQHGSARRSALHRSLLLAQTALSVLLLVGAGLFVRSLHRLETLDLGLNTRDVRTVQVRFAGSSRKGREIVAFYEQALERVRALPGVERATLATGAPLQTGRGALIRLRGAADWFRSDAGQMMMNWVADDFFETVGMRIIAGRGLTASDRNGSPVVVVNEALARAAWPGRSPVGDCVYLSSSQDACTEVVGVVGNAHTFSIQEKAQRPWLYAPEPPDDVDLRVLLVRVKPGMPGVESSVQRALREIDPSLPFIDIRVLGDVLDPQLRPWRLGATLFTTFGVLAMLLALLGLYAAVAYAVTQRTREIGVRMAVGATAGNVVRLVLGDGTRIALAGIATGLLLALLGGPLIADLLFEVSPRDPLVLASVGGGVLLAAILASLVPARRAAHVDPVTALRVE